MWISSIKLNFLRSSLCGYDIDLYYPQNGTIPSVPLVLPTQRDVPFLLQSKTSYKNLMSELVRRHALQKRDPRDRRRENLAIRKNDFWNGRSLGTIDPWVSGRFLKHVSGTRFNS